jgi:hypothetical protein
MDIADVDGFDWLAMGEVVQRLRNFQVTDLMVIVSDNTADTVGEIFDQDGKLMPIEDIGAFARNSVPQLEDEQKTGDEPCSVLMHIQTPGWTMKTPDGVMHTVDRVDASLIYTINELKIPLRLHRYAGGGKDYAFASAPFSAGDITGQIVMVRQEDETTEIYFVPDGMKC